MQRQLLGKLGEELALSYLERKGYIFVDKNARSPFGEIDLILKDKDTLVFVEVKTRWSQKYGTPEAAVSQKKISRIVKSALWFKQRRPKMPDKMRIDVVAVEVELNGDLKNIRHIINILA